MQRTEDTPPCVLHSLFSTKTKEAHRGRGGCRPLEVVGFSFKFGCTTFSKSLTQTKSDWVVPSTTCAMKMICKVSHTFWGNDLGTKCHSHETKCNCKPHTSGAPTACSPSSYNFLDAGAFIRDGSWGDAVLVEKGNSWWWDAFCHLEDYLQHRHQHAS